MQRTADRPVATGASATPTVTPTEMAWLTEHAFGLEKDAWVVLNDDGKVVVTPEKGRKQPLLNVKAEKQKVRMGRPDEIIMQIGAKQKHIFRDRPDVDSLFLTPSAIEKFLVPYYYAQRLYGEDAIAKFRAECDQDVIAVAHVAPSLKHEIRATDTVMLAVRSERDKEGVLWQSLTDYLVQKSAKQ